MTTNAPNTQETSSTAQRFADEAKEKIERTVESVTGMSRERIHEMADRATDKTAAAIDRATEYIRNVDLRSQVDDLWAAMRRNPTPSIIAAAAVGFILGVSLRRR
jgi:ElaB/YqjD/DUF883 family membrane-anchored ribosome-binding protein